MHSSADELPSWVTVLKSPRRGGGVLYMVGTTHVSEKSARRVQQAIRQIKPKLVMLELCKKRKHILESDRKGRDSRHPGGCFAASSEILRLSLSGQGSVALLGYLLSRFSARVAHRMNTVPGHEFRVAAAEARRQRASLILGDRDFAVTVRRMWGAMSWFESLKLCLQLFYLAFLCTSQDGWTRLTTAELIREMGKHFPSIMKAMVHERDSYMAHVLRHFVDQGETVVAVVGKAHVSGICQRWKDNVDVQQLLSVPTVGVGAVYHPTILLALVGVLVMLISAYMYATL